MGKFLLVVEIENGSELQENYVLAKLPWLGTIYRLNNKYAKKSQNPFEKYLYILFNNVIFGKH